MKGLKGNARLNARREYFAVCKEQGLAPVSPRILDRYLNAYTDLEELGAAIFSQETHNHVGHVPEGHLSKGAIIGSSLLILLGSVFLFQYSQSQVESVKVCKPALEVVGNKLVSSTHCSYEAIN